MSANAAQLVTPGAAPPPVKAVLFDFDGTLWDPEPGIFQAYQEVFGEYGCTLSGALWASVIGTIGFDLWSRLEDVAGRPVDRAGAERSLRRAVDVRLAALRPRPGIRAVLDAVDAAGLPRGIVSNSTESWIRRYARQCALDDGWRTVCSAQGDPSVAKPAPRLYLRALAELGVRAEETLAFEDSPSGVRAAAGAGIRCVAVPNAMTAGLDFGMAHLVLDSYRDVDLAGLLTRHVV